MLCLPAALLASGARSAAAYGSLAIGFGFPLYPPPPPVVYGPPPVVYAPPPVVYAPPPVVYAPPPVVYAPAPVVYAPPPVPADPPPAAAPVTVTPVSGADGGQTCREYQTTTVIGGVPQRAYGTACLQADGSWRMVN
jgi:hypothetical protein